MVRRIDHDRVDRARLHCRRAVDDHLRLKWRNKFAYFFARPSDALIASWDKVSDVRGIDQRSDRRLRTDQRDDRQAAPLICAGLGVGLAFRAGLFNIGAQGQAILGAIVAAYIGFVGSATWHTSPAGHPRGAARWRILGRHRGLAKTGAHEVIVTIMMNYIALGLLAYLLTTPAFQRPGGPTRFPPSWTGTPPCHD